MFKHLIYTWLFTENIFFIFSLYYHCFFPTGKHSSINLFQHHFTIPYILTVGGRHVKPASEPFLPLSPPGSEIDLLALRTAILMDWRNGMMRQGTEMQMGASARCRLNTMGA